MECCRKSEKIAGHAQNLGQQDLLIAQGWLVRSFQLTAPKAISVPQADWDAFDVFIQAVRRKEVVVMRTAALTQQIKHSSCNKIRGGV